MRKLTWTLLLPFLLLFVQQGALIHEYGHYRAAVSGRDQAPADADPCLECLAYAQIGGATEIGALPVALLSHLSFRLQSAPRLFSAEAWPASPRSRGPPVL